MADMLKGLFGGAKSAVSSVASEADGAIPPSKGNIIHDG